jgi:hypothetical protein
LNNGGGAVPAPARWLIQRRDAAATVRRVSRVPVTLRLDQA